MNQTIDVLRAEATRLRSLAGRLEALALELDGPSPSGRKEAGADQKKSATGPYSGITQNAAILRALEDGGPQTTAELFNRLNVGGQAFKKRTYVTALLFRLKDKVERLPEGKVKLRTNGA